MEQRSLNWKSRPVLGSMKPITQQGGKYESILFMVRHIIAQYYTQK